MTVHLANLSGIVLVYVLVFARTGAMIMLLPAIGQAGIPLARAARSCAGHLLRVRRPWSRMPIRSRSPPSVLALGLMLAQEITAGVLVGLMASIIMSAFSVAGALIATQTGLSYAQSIDPTMGEQSRDSGKFPDNAGRGAHLRHRPASSRHRRHPGQLHADPAGSSVAHGRHGGAGGAPCHAARSVLACNWRRRSSSSHLPSMPRPAFSRA